MQLLAFDLGAESGRAVLGTLHDDRLTIDEKHRFANIPVNEKSHLHWDFAALWNHVRAGLKQAVLDAPRLDGIGVDTWGVDYGLLTRDGQLIGRPFHYRDARTDGLEEFVFTRLRRDQIYRATGVQFMQLNTLFQLVAHQRDDPETLAQADRLLFMPDLFNFHLTGARHTEPTIASTSQLYDPVAHDWASEIIDALHIRRALLPPIEPSGARAGLSEDLARECRLERPCPVIWGAGHDTAAAVAAVPARSDDGNWCYISSGTWSLVGIELDHPVISPEAQKLNFTNEVGARHTIRLLKNIMGLWLVQECRRDFARRGEDFSYVQLVKMASECESCGSIVDPNDARFFSAGDMPAKVEQFCRRTNQPAPASAAQTIRCCFESLAVTYRRAIEGLQALTGKRIDVIHVVGGGSQNDLLNQMTADACGRTVCAGPVEATSIGNLLVQAMALGAVSSLHELRRIVARSFEVKRFEPRDAQPWESLYRRSLEVASA
jgi:rhamnulokinase